MPTLTRTVSPPGPVDLALTLAPLRVGRGDPTIRLTPTEAVRATRTPEGPATLHLQATSAGRVDARAWGPGAPWALEHIPDLLGCADRPEELRTTHPLIRDLHRRVRGLRLTRTNQVSELVPPTVLGQKVTGREQKRSWYALVRTYGEPAPGPSELEVRLPPRPDVLTGLPYHRYHPLGVERRRADAIRFAGHRAVRLDEAAAMSPAAAFERITAFPGLGPWTAAIVVRTTHGDPDQVELGDYHLPNLVSWNLAGRARGDDAQMLELLAPFAGQRGRVTRLLELGGQMAPKFGPRQPIRSLAAI